MRIATTSDSGLAEVGSSTSSPGVSLHEWLDEDSKESLNDEERKTERKTERKHGKENQK